MARTRAKTKKDPNDPPSYRWSKLQHHDKIICYNYYIYTATEGEQGWNPARAGSVDHYRSSAYIESLGSDSWFRHRAKLMVTLAEAFRARNEAPPQPNNTAPAAAAAAPVAAPSVTNPAANRAPPRPQPNQDAFTASSNRPEMNSPNPRRQGTPSRAGTPVPSVPGSIGVPNDVSDTAVDDPAGITVPTCFGSHEGFDYTTRKSHRHILAKSLLHNAVRLEDLSFNWISPRRLVVNVAWPDFFLYAEQMAACTTDAQNNMIFPPEHALTQDTCRRNAMLVGEDGKVWDVGTFSFEQDMKQDNPIVELLDVHLADRNIDVKVLQIYAE